MVTTLLKELVQADPQLDMQCEPPDKVIIIFRHNGRDSDLTLRCWEGVHPMNRIQAALQTMIGHLVYCERCPHKRDECRSQTGQILATLRLILGPKGLDQLRERLRERYKTCN